MFANWKGSHYVLLGLTIAVGVVASYKAVEGHDLMVGGVAVGAVVTALLNLFAQSPASSSSSSGSSSS